MCGCWFVFDVEDPMHWKILDFVICDNHVKRSQVE
jgi:hypothetical protein